MDHGLILINAGSNIIRFVPALITEKQHIDEMAQILRGAIERNL
jgi:acetylornithine/N-succinyldiaminopimelate aminotransferase